MGFEESVVVCVTGGLYDEEGGYKIRISNIRRTGDAFVVDIRRAGPSDHRGQDIAEAFHVVKYPRAAGGDPYSAPWRVHREGVEVASTARFGGRWLPSSTEEMLDAGVVPFRTVGGGYAPSPLPATVLWVAESAEGLARIAAATSNPALRSVAVDFGREVVLAILQSPAGPGFGHDAFISRVDANAVADLPVYAILRWADKLADANMFARLEPRPIPPPDASYHVIVVERRLLTNAGGWLREIRLQTLIAGPIGSAVVLSE